MKTHLALVMVLAGTSALSVASARQVEEPGTAVRGAAGLRDRKI